MARDLTSDELRYYQQRGSQDNPLEQQEQQVGRGGLFGSAVDSLQGQLYGLGEAAGLSSLRDMRLANEADAQRVAESYYRQTGNPRSWRDVGSAGELGSFVLDQGVQSAPTMGAIIGSSLINPALGYAASATLGTADVVDNQRQAGGRTNLVTAVPLGLAYGASDMLLGTTAGMARRTLGTGVRALDDLGTSALSKIPGKTGMAARLGVGLAKRGAAEAVDETFQQVMNQAGRASVSDETMLDAGAMDRYADSAVTGGLLGMGFGLPGSVHSGYAGGPKKQPTLPPDVSLDNPTQPANLLAPTSFSGPRLGANAESGLQGSLFNLPDAPAQSPVNRAIPSENSELDQLRSDMGELTAMADAAYRQGDRAAYEAISDALRQTQAQIRLLEPRDTSRAPLLPSGVSEMVSGRPVELFNYELDNNLVPFVGDKGIDFPMQQGQGFQYTGGIEPTGLYDALGEQPSVPKGDARGLQRQPTQTEIPLFQPPTAPVMQVDMFGNTAATQDQIAQQNDPGAVAARQQWAQAAAAGQQVKAEKQKFQQTAARAQAAGLDAKKPQQVQLWGKIEAAIDEGVITAEEGTKLAANVVNKIDTIGSATKFLEGKAATKAALDSDNASQGTTPIKPVVTTKTNEQVPATQSAAPATTGGLPATGGTKSVEANGTVEERVKQRLTAWAQQFPQMPKYEWLSQREVARLKDLEARGELNLAAAQTVLGANKNQVSVDETEKIKREADAFRNSLAKNISSLSAEDAALLQDWLGVDVDASGELVLREGGGKSYESIGALLPNKKTGKLGMSKSAVEKRVKAALKEAGAPEEMSRKDMFAKLGFQLAGTDLETIERNMDVATKDDSVVAPTELTDGQKATDDGVARAQEMESGSNDDVGVAEDNYTQNFEVARTEEEGALGNYLAQELVSGKVLPSDIAEAVYTFDTLLGKGAGAFWSNPVSRQAEAIRQYARVRAAGSDPVVAQAKQGVADAAKAKRSGTELATRNPEAVRSGAAEVQGDRIPNGAGSVPSSGQAGSEVRQAGSQAKAPAVIVKKRRTPFTGEVTIERSGQPVNGPDSDLPPVEVTAAGNAAGPREAPETRSAKGRPYLATSQQTVSQDGKFDSPMRQVTDKAALEADNQGYQLAAESLRKLGLDHILAGVDLYIAPKSAFSDPRERGAFTVVNGRIAILLREDILTGPAQGELRWAAMHEYGHAVDFLAANNGYISDGAPWSVRITNGQVVASGSAAREFIALAKTDPLVAKLLTYPLADTTLSAREMSNELFAQAFFLHASGKIALPQSVVASVQGATNVAKTTAAQPRLSNPVQGDTGVSGAGSISGSGDQATRTGPQTRSAKAATQNPGSTGSTGRAQQGLNAEEYARKIAGSTGAKIVIDAKNLATKALDSLAYLHDIVEAAKAKIPSAEGWYKSFMETVATRGRLIQDADKIAAMVTQKGVRKDKVDAMLYDATFDQKWPYDTTRKDRKTGQDIVIKADPELARRFNAELTQQERDIVKAVFDHGEKMLALKYEIMAKLGLNGVFANESGKLQGPYAPLKRFGNYITVLKSDALAKAEGAEDDKLVEKLKADPAHYEVRFHDTKGEASEYARTNAKGNGGQWDNAYHFEKSERVGQAQPMSAHVLAKVRAALDMEGDLPPEAVRNFEQMLQDLEFQALSEHHARTSGLKRKNRAGADADMMRSFQANAKAQANFLAQLQHGQETNSQFYKMQRDATKGQHAGQDEFNLLAKHYAASFDNQETTWRKVEGRLTAFTTTMQLSTSLGYHIANALQGVMVTLPKLAADFNNYSGAWDQLLKGYSVWKELGGAKNNFDISKVKDSGLRSALQRAADMGVLDVGMEEDVSQFEAFRTGYGAIDKASDKGRKVLHKLRQVSRYVETMNRVAAATAGYNMAMEKYKDSGKAQEYAVRLLQTTQGDFSNTGAPLIFKRLPKFVMQYKKYQFMMGVLYAKAFRDSFVGATPEEKAMARRFLAYKLAHTSLAAGALGLPLANLAAMVFGWTGDEDEPKDLERSLREAIGDETLANAILHGPLAALGLDLSAKLGDDKIFSIAPYTDIDFSSGAAAAKTLVGVVGGPAGSQIMRMAGGVEYLARGEYQKGVENLVPSGLANMSKAYRIANDGFTLKNGTLMYTPDEISGMALLADAIGLKSSEMKHMEWVRGQQYEVERYFTEHSKEIKADYVRARREDDGETARELERRWVKMQDIKREMRPLFNNAGDALKTAPLSELLKAPAAARKRDIKAQDRAI